MGKKEQSAGRVNTGLLIMRIGVGVLYILYHGWPKIMAGPERWAQLGMAMGSIGINFGYVFWGFMAAFAEFVGGIALVLGLFTRFFAGLMFLTMLVATVMHLRQGDGIGIASHSLKMGVVLLGLVFTGAGSFSLGSFISNISRKK